MEFYYFQNSRELDFYLPNYQLAIEVKYKDKITREDIKPLQLEAIPKKAKRIIVTRDILKKVDDIHLIPAHLVTFSPLFP
ncbi:hypothetical protein A2960_05580 [Candidatus Gottesmanbacteria bacterium RIFCSPLOWO2_01_FULL_39_12b]|uniref:DUF4143 domain-containing protein n=1 Tax=Candidatus Gottesmanbacteria bacterium RIFCSPLOWO2_01_FULL_39_12b TaxID=1798388 RepID=A0A1F6ANZ4_9BACT|nr:MAG: hypothetical protein A2960_05580 [Candidatus Gottesmanbacteria bacterium RIFCSPLOWO2_01_FULL_39_12b]